MPRMLAILLACVWLVPGCGDDDVGGEGGLVGGPCQDSVDCEFRCERGEEYPDGTCIVPCNTDDDCPVGSSCINREDGVCLLSCELPEDCRPGYDCEGQENRGHGGDSLVCIGND